MFFNYTATTINNMSIHRYQYKKKTTQPPTTATTKTYNDINTHKSNFQEARGVLVPSLLDGGPYIPRFLLFNRLGRTALCFCMY